MAQLILTAASAAVSTIGRAGLGAVIARSVAGTAAAYAAAGVDRLIFGPRRRRIEGPRLDALQIQASTEGAAILKVYGRARIAGQIIWASRFRETTATTTQTTGGKGGRGAVRTETTEHLYSISLAIGLCEGPIDRVARVWADGRPFDMTGVNARVHRGDEAQTPDDLILAVEGAAPAYRGLAYVVFEDLPLKAFGNRIPQFQFEIEKAPGAQPGPADLEQALRAVTIIPGSGEFVYATTPVLRDLGEGASVSENRHAVAGLTDFSVSLDALCAAAPNLGAASLVVSWFGDDLRAGRCLLKPGVETAEKTTSPHRWRVGGVVREGARLVSTIDGAPAFGGTPSDRSVLEAIAAMKARGLSVMLHPFILMDVPAGANKPDPSGVGLQGAYPWRGRIAPAAHDPGGVAGAVAAFVGAARPGDFAIAVSPEGIAEVVYNGPAEWSLRRMVLHYAHLAMLAGGVEAFLLGSELRALTTARDSAGGYPFVDALIALAADVRSILGPAVRLSYGADWSEYFGHQPADGSGDVAFHLDHFWADENVDFVGIHNYMPLADWRDGLSHLDAAAAGNAPAGPHDGAYLGANIAGGEGFDWYYASPADRAAQVRTPITDGAYGEPFVFRPKDIAGWWASVHHDRPAGVRSPVPTPWIPASKPVRFTEIGCPAVDRGANEPNLFIDPKSAESALPAFSSGSRDDLAQRRFLEAHHRHWSDPAHNPVSPVYGGPMVPPDGLYVYAWDARPYPYFPARADVWGDAANWQTGHWLNGRLGAAPLDRLVRALAAEAGVAVESSALRATLGGYVVDRPMSVREMIDPLADIFQFDAVESDGRIRFQPRDAGARVRLSRADLVRADNAGADAADFTLAIADVSEAPGALRLGFLDEGADYAPAVAEAREPSFGADGATRVAGIEAAAVMQAGAAEARVRAILADAHVMRETLRLTAPPSRLGLEPGDCIAIDLGAGERLYRITGLSDARARRLELVRMAPEVYDAAPGLTRFTPPPPPAVVGAPLALVLDLPLLADTDDPQTVRLAADARPWPGAVAFYHDAGAPVFAARLEAPSLIGRLETPLAPARSGLWSPIAVRIRLNSGALESRSEAEVLAGANDLAIDGHAGWEVAQFRQSRLEPDGSWLLTGWLRAQAGTEAEAAAGAPAGARVVVLRGLGAYAPPIDAIDTTLSLVAGPAGEAPTHPAFRAVAALWRARALKPLSPVHLRAEAGPDGVRLRWIRRTRIGGDKGWGDSDVPVAEAFERYRVDILAAGLVVHSVDVPAPEHLYSAAQSLVDFGAPTPPAGVVVRVAQLSDLAGAGAPATITL